MEQKDNVPGNAAAVSWEEALGALGLSAGQTEALTQAYEREVTGREDALRREYEQRLSDSAGEYTRRLRHMALMDALEREGVQEKELRLLLEKNADESLFAEGADGSPDASGVAGMLKSRYPVCFAKREDTRVSPPLSPVSTSMDDLDDNAYYRAVLANERRK